MTILLAILLIIVAILILTATILMIVWLSKTLNKNLKATNYDMLIGKTGKVTTAISNIDNIGLIQIEGQVWSAKSVNNTKIPVDATVVVKGIEGVKLIVEEGGVQD